MSKKILITGGSGFIGRNIKEYLSDFYDVSAPSHNELDLTDTQKTFEYLKENQFDIVIHSANTNNTLRLNVSDYEVLNGNLRMYWNLSSCSQFYEKLLYFGSGAEYNMRHYILNMDENYFGTYIPEDAYGFSKYVMNQYTRKSDNIYNLRLFGVYGRYEEWNRRFISNNICRVLKGMDISINQEAVFDYLYIEDLYDIVIWFINHTPQYHDYNVCSGQPIFLSDIAKIIQKKYSCKVDICKKSRGERLPYVGNNKKLIKEIGKYEFTNIEKGIDDLFHYYKYLFDTNVEFQKLVDKEIKL